MQRSAFTHLARERCMNRSMQSFEGFTPNWDSASLSQMADDNEVRVGEQRE